MARFCVIDMASIEDEDGAGDGAYGLHDVCGTPEEIGKAIAETLAECDMSMGPAWSYIDNGEPLYLNIRIKVAAEAKGKPEAIKEDVAIELMSHIAHLAELVSRHMDKEEYADIQHCVADLRQRLGAE